jgi:hypothetical protein
MKRRMWLGVTIALLVLVALALMGAQGKERIGWAVIDRLTVLEGGADILSETEFGDEVTFSGDITFEDGLTLNADDLALSGGAVTMTLDSLTVSGGDVTLSADDTGGNALAKSEFIGLPRIKMVALATGHDGSAETTAFIDATPTGEWAATGVSVTVAADTDYYRVGANSLAATWAITATAGDGISGTITPDDWEANESLGFWAYPTVEIVGGDLEIMLTDDTETPTATVDITLTADMWQWVEVDISDCSDSSCDAVSEIIMQLTVQGAANLDEFTLYLDGMYKWDADDEEALGAAIQQDGVLSIMSLTTVESAANTPTILAEYTDYFVHYEDGNDFVVWISNQSARSNVALIAY